MARRTKFTVTYGSDIARFSDYIHAMQFARMISKSRHSAEVSSKELGGIIGQYVNGETTPEFKMHDSVLEGVQ
jgi:hypothetical protein